MAIHKSTTLFTMLMSLVFSGCLAWLLLTAILRVAHKIVLNLN